VSCITTAPEAHNLLLMPSFPVCSAFLASRLRLEAALSLAEKTKQVRKVLVGRGSGGAPIFVSLHLLSRNFGALDGHTTAFWTDLDV
jgi:hypothetical protein